jgi:hypothetical protein
VELLRLRPGVPHIQNPEDKKAYEKHSRSENRRSHSSPPSIRLVTWSIEHAIRSDLSIPNTAGDSIEKEVPQSMVLPLALSEGVGLLKT